MKQPSPGDAASRKHVPFLAANPGDIGRLALDREAHAIHLELQRSGYRDRFEFVTRWAIEPVDLLRELRQYGASDTAPGDRCISALDE
jgi:hypothetical protein